MGLGVTYLLDNNVISFFWNRGREKDLAFAATKVALAIVAEVRDEAARHPTYGARFTKWLPGTQIGCLEIALGSKAHVVLAELTQAQTTTKDMGERASVALASTIRDLVFVTHDTNATVLAHRELFERGERVIGLAVFLRRLAEDAGTSPVALDDVMQVSQHGKRPPTWWPSWRANLPS